MFKKLVTIVSILILLPVFLFAQERTLLKQNGEIVRIKGETRDADLHSISKLYKPVQNKNARLNPVVTPVNSMNLIDTMFVPGPYRATPFGFYGQDWMVMWYKAPADLYLLQVGFWCMIDTSNTTLEVKIVNVNWTEEQLLSYETDTGPLGYYEAQGNGYNDISAFEDNPDVTGGWVALPGFENTPPPFGHDLWGDNGIGAPVIPTVYPDPANPGYDWVDLNILGVPDIEAGTIFGIAIKDTWPVQDPNSPYVGFGLHDSGVNTIPQTLIKFHSNGRNTTTDYGWWVRPLYPLCFSAIVEIYGNTPPDINSFTELHSDINTGPFTVDANITDENPGTPDSAGVASAMIQWSIDGGTTWNDVAMTGSEPNFTGQIPAQPGNTMVTYRISATDITNLVATTAPVNFYVFEPSGANTLVIFNGFNELTGFPVDSYWPSNVSFEHDSWNYGEATTAVLDNYTNVIEIWNENFGVYNDSTIKIWIEGNGNRNYFLAGQEYLGAKNGYVDSAYTAGSFEYDILGIDSSFNDISYYYVPPTSTTSYGDSLPTWNQPVAGTMLGQPLKDLLDSVTGADSLMFNPIGVYQSPDHLNWQDGFHALSDVEVDMMVETRGMGDDRTQPIVRTIPTLAHRTLTAGNKIVFNAYDPVSLTTANDDSYPYWYWVGPDHANTVFQTLQWFGVPLSADEVGGSLPTEFALEQNYPNPFNPATTIKFSIPEQSIVTLKIYDVLGREVSTLVNNVKNAGSHEVNFNASNLASGMYIYKITAGNYTASKKMMLLK